MRNMAGGVGMMSKPTPKPTPTPKPDPNSETRIMVEIEFRGSDCDVMAVIKSLRMESVKLADLLTYSIDKSIPIPAKFNWIEKRPELSPDGYGLDTVKCTVTVSTRHIPPPLGGKYIA
jgi:hypothetical protein